VKRGKKYYILLDLYCTCYIYLVLILAESIGYEELILFGSVRNRMIIERNGSRESRGGGSKWCKHDLGSSTESKKLASEFLPRDASAERGDATVSRLYFSEYKMFWHELLLKHHGQSVLPTSAEISTGCQSISVSSTNYLY